ncbi:hypothetical protein ACHAWF_003604, partial [Thalassiosira exigua]
MNGLDSMSATTTQADADADADEVGRTKPRTRRQTGRSARRRRRKARAILDASATAETLHGGAAASTVVATATSVPSDRERVLDGVRIRRREDRERRRRPDARDNGDEGGARLDPRDERALLSQLGFLPGNAVCVAARLSSDWGKLRIGDSSCDAVVLKLYPLAVRDSYGGGKSDGRAFKGRKRGSAREGGPGNGDARVRKIETEREWVVEGLVRTNEPGNSDETESNQPEEDEDQQCEPPHQIIEPFPTLYWLTSPQLRAEISKLELSKTHSVPRMEERLRSSPAHLRQMARAHESYGRRRWELLTDEDKQKINERGWKDALDESRGVAGICMKDGRCDRVKCLHAHAAHYLAQLAERNEGAGTATVDPGGCDGGDWNL